MQSMKALLLIAHGSRVAASNDEIRQLADKLRNVASGSFDLVECAFLELAEPSILRGVQSCIDAGAREVLALPYFLAAGRHVLEDIPAELQKKRVEHPSVRIGMCDYFGKSPGVAGLLLGLAEKDFAG